MWVCNDQFLWCTVDGHLHHVQRGGETASKEPLQRPRRNPRTVRLRHLGASRNGEHHDTAKSGCHHLRHCLGSDHAPRVTCGCVSRPSAIASSLPARPTVEGGSFADLVRRRRQPREVTSRLWAGPRRNRGRVDHARASWGFTDMRRGRWIKRWLTSRRSLVK